jgi:hypothetical protein
LGVQEAPSTSGATTEAGDHGHWVKLTRMEVEKARPDTNVKAQATWSQPARLVDARSEVERRMSFGRGSAQAQEPVIGVGGDYCAVRCLRLGVANASLRHRSPLAWRLDGHD